MKEKEKEDEELQKKLDSKKHFESWKSNKEKELIEHRQKLKEEKREKRRKEFEDQEEKRSSSKKVYENWYVRPVASWARYTNSIESTGVQVKCSWLYS